MEDYIDPAFHSTDTTTPKAANTYTSSLLTMTMLASASTPAWPAAQDTAASDIAVPWLASMSSTESDKILIPPREFSRIAPDIYASCLPHPRAVPFLESLRIRSALFFAHKQHPLNLELSAEVRSWITGLQEHKWSPIDKVKGHGKIAMSQAGAKAALEVGS